MSTLRSVKFTRPRLVGFWLTALAPVIAWSCYSSNAPPLPTETENEDAALPVAPRQDGATCVPRRPWDGPGVTGVLPIRPGGDNVLVISADHYAVAELDTAPADAGEPRLGSVVAWRESGHLRDLWSSAPPALGGRPWDPPGVTAAYVDKLTGDSIIVSQFRRWRLKGSEWIAAGSIADELIVNDAGPPVEDGGRAPWAGPGVTAASYTGSGGRFHMYSRDREWVRITSDSDPSKWLWINGGALTLATTNPWPDAPQVGGQRPHEGPGITAVFFIGPKLVVFSVDKYWTTDQHAWFGSGFVKDAIGWSSAPTVGCER